MDLDALERVQKRMAKIDAMSKELRELVHEHGLTVVQAFLDCGVMKPNQIKHLIEQVKQGAVEVGNRTGLKNGMLEGWSQTVRMVSVPSEPTRRMVEASMSEVSNFDVECTKYEKHRRRLVAAIKASGT